MEQTVDNNVQGWLMNIPYYPSEITNSEDSINLDELINVNFTTSMEEETYLNDLSLLDLDDSKEDFWKVDNIYNTLDTSSQFYLTSNKTRPPAQNRYIKPSASTSTSSFDSQSTEASIISRTTLPLAQSTIRRKEEQKEKHLKPENTQPTRPASQIFKRASHIPAPSTTRHSIIIPQSTKSTVSSHQPNRSLNRLAGSRASHIPPPRSTTSLGISSLSSNSPPKSMTRSKTSLLNPPRTSSLRAPSPNIHRF